mgnify:CR=1 FL=1
MLVLHCGSPILICQVEFIRGLEVCSLIAVHHFFYLCEFENKNELLYMLRNGSFKWIPRREVRNE